MNVAQNLADPEPDCARCPRLVGFRCRNAAAEPAWHNGPVPSFGVDTARLLIVGLAPGLKGANRTGRPFTGDYAGDLLYGTLLATGFAHGTYGASATDGLSLLDCRITNAVRCVPPENKPTTAEAGNCRVFLAATIEGMPKLAAVLALGRLAHDNVLTTLGLPRSRHPFKHGAAHAVGAALTLYDSYHCSRYNTNTGVLTPAMFECVLQAIASDLRHGRRHSTRV